MTVAIAARAGIDDDARIRHIVAAIAGGDMQNHQRRGDLLVDLQVQAFLEQRRVQQHPTPLIGVGDRADEARHQLRDLD